MQSEYGEDRADDGRRQFIEDAMAVSEPLDDSLTNTVGETEVGTVLKKFERNKVTPRLVGRGKQIFGGTYMFGGVYEIEGREERIENERMYRDVAEDAGLYAPKILGEYEEYMEFERIDGTPLREYVTRSDADEVAQIGEYLGQSMRNLHENEYAITDFRMSNVFVQENGSLAFVDYEYATDNATNGEKELDQLTLLSSARQLDAETWQPFREGFESGYGEDIGAFVDASTNITSFLHATILERDRHRATNAMRNSSFGQVLHTLRNGAENTDADNERV